MLVRLRFSDDLAALTGVSLGSSGAAGAASSRARALVDRRGSDIVCVETGTQHYAMSKRLRLGLAPCLKLMQPRRVASHVRVTLVPP